MASRHYTTRSTYLNEYLLNYTYTRVLRSCSWLVWKSWPSLWNSTKPPRRAREFTQFDKHAGPRFTRMLVILEKNIKSTLSEGSQNFSPRLNNAEGIILFIQCCVSYETKFSRRILYSYWWQSRNYVSVLFEQFCMIVCD